MTGKPPANPTLDNPKFTLAFRGLGEGNVLIDCRFCPEVVTVPGGRAFKIGAASTEAGASAYEEPQTAVQSRAPFAVGRFEVTNAEWDACVRDNACKGPLRSASGDSRLGRLPVTNVSWDDAHDFVRWASRVSGQRYRLPTEAEWEYAARAQEDGAEPTPYFFGSKVADLCEAANGADQRLGPLFNTNVLCDDGIGREVAPVGLYRPNAFGLFDVSGNVWEWVEDCWAPSHHGHPVGADGIADASVARLPSRGTCDTRVVKGGSWRSGPAALRSASRNAFPADHQRSTIGFRVVREIEQNPVRPTP